ncbi:MAG: sensor histidine kinase, partial [Acidimicrobiia bacterium]
RADLEESIEDVLTDAGVEEPWRLSTVMVDAGFTADDLIADNATSALAYEVAAVDAEASALMREIAEGSHRLSDLVGALKSYSFLDQAPVQEVDVIKGIDDTLLILRSKMGDITVDKDYAEDLPTIVAYGSQLNQVWTNLLDNAADAIHAAMDDGGVVQIRAAQGDEDTVVIEIENNGPAIPDEVIDHIFEAFYTTKEPGKGTGLGLDTAYSIVVAQHRGTISVRSENDATVFTVALPLEQDTSTA